jgi:nucleotide-binding universal stress UspA family protein
VTIKRILCPVDFSDASTHAVEQAVAIAGWYKARITALHVYHPLFMPVPGLPVPDDRVPPSELRRVREQVETCFQAAMAAGIGVDVEIGVGHATAQILDRATDLPAQMIVMGTHGASGFEHLVLGSVTEKVLRKARCAVLTVPPRAHATSKLPFKRLLCAVDFSDGSLTALDFAASLAQESGAQLTVVHVLEWPWQEPPAPVMTDLPPEQGAALAEYRRYLEASATDRLRAFVVGAAPAGVSPAPRLVHGKPYVEILRVAGEERADLVVMGVCGRNALDVMLLGSTTNQVVRRATCPVLTLRHYGP